MFNQAESDATIKGTWSITEMQLEQQRIDADMKARIAEAEQRTEQVRVQTAADIKKAKAMDGESRAILIGVVALILGVLVLCGYWAFNTWQNNLIEERMGTACVQSGGQWVLKYSEKSSYRECVRP